MASRVAVVKRQRRIVSSLPFPDHLERVNKVAIASDHLFELFHSLKDQYEIEVVKISNGRAGQGEIPYMPVSHVSCTIPIEYVQTFDEFWSRRSFIDYVPTSERDFHKEQPVFEYNP